MNPLHAGLVTSSQGLQRGEHFERRYWDPEVREQLLEAFAARKRWSKTNTSKETTYLLNGLVFCARCGERLYAVDQKGRYRYYYCRKGQNTGKFTCPGVRVADRHLEDAVVEQIGRVAKEPQLRALLLAEAER